MLTTKTESTGKVIRWPGGNPKDVPSIPTDPRVVFVLRKYHLAVKMGENCYEVVNASGDAMQLPFGIPLGDWEPACAAFVKQYG